MFLVFAVLVGLIPVIPAVVYVLQNGKTSPAQAVSRMVTGFNGFNLLVGLFADKSFTLVNACSSERSITCERV